VFFSEHSVEQETLTNVKVSARQQCVCMKVPSEEIYGKLP